METLKFSHLLFSDSFFPFSGFSSLLNSAWLGGTVALFFFSITLFCQYRFSFQA